MADIEMRTGNTGKWQVALKHNGTLIPWNDLATPRCWIRKPSSSVAIEIGVEEYTDEPTLYNASVVFAAGDTDDPGTYYLEVDATISGEAKTIPNGPAHITVLITPHVG